ncbi:hypothetical protein H8D59_02550 [bacterium]|nr:hypothetical protein [bacterium]MBL7052234.1 hypothetical protein [Candidatus Neomarinimicrobiota bacterium]
MKITELDCQYEKAFPEKTLLKGFEGGCIYLAEKCGKFYLITDESALSAFFDSAGTIQSVSWTF